METNIESWDDLRIVLAVAHEGSYRAAAKTLGITSTTVARHVERMTADVGTPIFVFKDNKWSPTALGHQLLEVADEVQSRLGLLLAERRGGDVEVQSLKMIVAAFVAEEFVATHMDLWMKANPTASVEIESRKRPLMVERGDVDVVLCLNRPDKMGVSRFKVANVEFGLFRAQGAKEKNWVGLHSDRDEVSAMQMAHRFFQQPPAVRVSSFRAVAQVAQDMESYCVLPTCVARSFDGLVEVHGFNKPASCNEPLWFAFHESRKDDDVIIAAKEWIRQIFPSPSKCLCGKCNEPTSNPGPNNQITMNVHSIVDRKQI